MTVIPKLTLRTPSDILAAVPYVVGFHPADSLVVLGFGGTELLLTTRWDLRPEPRGLEQLGPLLRREKITMAVIVGYGPEDVVDAPVLEVGRLLEKAGVHVMEALRAEDGRYWSYACETIVCCPEDGMPYDPVSSPVAAEAVVRGLVALPDREALRSSVTPSGGAAMRDATRAEAVCLRSRLGGRPANGLAAELVAEGLSRVREAIDLYDSGGRLDDRAAARLGFDLMVIRVRDEAWASLDDRDAHIALWTDLTRRLDPRHAAPAASLLAAAAWRSGDCALAGMALERALAADPGYSMARLLSQALNNLLSPVALRDRMPTSEELDAEMGTPRASWLGPLLEVLDDTLGDAFGEEPGARAS
ncbi:hypothetical protein Pth03_31720 [Planotetraspora thailandica]|uniref:DUF4192 domain-containing protein n=1 Tax=Planotetraspora thailandica TaxID=487172 RepID=A0A8J3XYP7_9ACTN|nr:DUF4192 domain-containing protein [Planotetraspora thailandica]GII54783.1 hypothetical protein Pth03_31720 [Planotetraspora thailandica]